MGLFDLVFIVAFLGVVVATIRFLAALGRRRWDTARRIASRTLGFVACYLVLVLLTSLFTPRRWIAIGQDQRFDDWTITVRRVEPNQSGFHVTAAVSNRGRGRAQRAPDAQLRLVMKDGRTISPLGSGDEGLRVMLAAGQSIDVPLEYAVPPGEEPWGLDVVHGGWPGLFIIGDRGSLMAKRPLVALGPTPPTPAAPSQ
jgi:hypothetical protein